MKINSLDPRSSSTSSVKDRGATSESSSGGGAGRVGSTSSSSASISLSPVALEAVSPGGVSALAGAFDTEKVDRIRQAVNDGSYRVNPGVIADRLIEFAMERLNMASR